MESLCTDSSWCRPEGTWFANVSVCFMCDDQICVYVFMSMCEHACVCIHAWVCLYVCAFVYRDEDMCVFVFAWDFVCVCWSKQYFEIILVFTIYKSLPLKIWVVVISWKLRWCRPVGSAFHRAPLTGAPATAGGRWFALQTFCSLRGLLICLGPMGVWADT